MRGFTGHGADRWRRGEPIRRNVTAQWRGHLHRNVALLLHYRMRVWNRAHHGALHFFGHSHGSLPGDRQSCDVGIDNPASGYAPWMLEEILLHLEGLPEREAVDNHGR